MWYGIKWGNPSGAIIWYMYISVFNICICNYMIILLSSPYLLVVGDDRVRGTREQMMLLQVVLVRLSYGARTAWEAFIFYGFEINCKSLWHGLYYFSFVIYGFQIIYLSNIVLKISRVFGKWGFIKWRVFIILFILLFKSVISWRDVTLKGP